VAKVLCYKCCFNYAGFRSTFNIDGVNVSGVLSRDGWENNTGDRREGDRDITGIKGRKEEDKG
jgi:hypothetical protein